jgi:hypothetical protein
MRGQPLWPVHAAQVYRAAAAPPNRESHGLRHDYCQGARNKSPRERGREALQRRVKLGKGTASAVPLNAKRTRALAPEEPPTQTHVGTAALGRPGGPGVSSCRRLQ